MALDLAKRLVLCTLSQDIKTFKKYIYTYYVTVSVTGRDLIYMCNLHFL